MSRVILLLIFLDLNDILNGDILTECGMDFYPNPGDTIICDDGCIGCRIHCNQNESCRNGIIVYSGAFRTIIDCSGNYGCQGSQFYFGNYSIPNGYSPELFDITGNRYDILCNGNSSCQNIKVYANVVLAQGITIIGNASDYTGNIKNAFISCRNLDDRAPCVLNCGDCTNTVFRCHSNTTCACNGPGCQDLINSTLAPSITPTSIPSISPIIIKSETPTQIPTEIPTKIPSGTPTMIPTMNPSITFDPPAPSTTPSMSPNIAPIINDSTAIPTAYPSIIPTSNPTNSLNPSVANTNAPTTVPHFQTTRVPSISPLKNGSHNDTILITTTLTFLPSMITTSTIIPIDSTEDDTFGRMST